MANLSVSTEEPAEDSVRLMELKGMIQALQAAHEDIDYLQSCEALDEELPAELPEESNFWWAI